MNSFSLSSRCSKSTVMKSVLANVKYLKRAAMRIKSSTTVAVDACVKRMKVCEMHANKVHKK